MTEWVELGTDTMRAAMKAQGLSHERAARQVPVSEKTWRRWIERGEVPVHLLPKVATILELEIEEPERVRVSVDGGVSDEDRLREILREELEGVRRSVASDLAGVLESFAARMEEEVAQALAASRPSPGRKR